MRQGCPPASGLQGSFRVFFQTVSNTNEFFHLWPTYSVIGYLLLTFFISRPQYSVIGYLLLTFFISGLIMSGSHQIRHDRMNDGLFRHWITEWTKLPSQILAEPVQDMDEILDSSTNSLMESDQDDDEDTKQNKLPSQILAEAVQDTDEILDFPTDSSMESDQDDDEETKNLKRKYKNLEKRTKGSKKKKMLAS